MSKERVREIVEDSDAAEIMYEGRRDNGVHIYFEFLISSVSPNGLGEKLNSRLYGTDWWVKVEEGRSYWDELDESYVPYDIIVKKQVGESFER